MMEPRTIRVLPKQKRFITSKAKFPAFIAGIGSGKTYAGCLRALLRLDKGQDGMIIAPTYPMLTSVTQRTFFWWCNELGLRYTFYKAEEKVEIAGAIVLFRSADSPERLRGPNLNWAYLDEAAMMNEMTWKIILGRLRVGDPSAWITTTPAGFNWVWRNWVSKGDPQYEAIGASTKDNIYLPKGYLEDLVANYTGEFAKQELEGDFVAFEGLVYPEFSPRIHVLDSFEPKEGMRLVRAVDHGYTNPFVCLWGAVDGDGRVVVYDEHYRAKTLIRDHVEAMRKRPGVFEFTTADHDTQDNAELRHAGIETRPAFKDVLRGIRKVKASLECAGDGRPRLYVHKRCTNLIREFGMYRWGEAKEGRNEKEEPLKENDHAMDALRYMVMELEMKRTFVYAGKD